MAINQISPDISLVSVITIFFNEEKFLREAIESVIAQTYTCWELLLVDDGSTDASGEIAIYYAERYSKRISYLEHPGHQNRGMSASRNLGIQHAQGEYIAFLDADDIWLPDKLADQVSIMNVYSGTGMVWGNLLNWFSWTQKPGDLGRDYVSPLGVQPDTLFHPPKLLLFFLSGKSIVPGPSSILVKHSVIQEVGGFESAFKNLYEDQAFYAKVCLRYPVYFSDKCWIRYRRHPDASTVISRSTGNEIPSREIFLKWLSSYLEDQGVDDNHVWQVLHAELWRVNYPDWLPPSIRLHRLLMWGKKWLLRILECILPDEINQRLCSYHRKIGP